MLPLQLLILNDRKPDLMLLLLSVFFLSLSNRDNYLGHPLHLSTILYPISQVQQGKALLVDFYSSQYGLYSHLIHLQGSVS